MKDKENSVVVCFDENDNCLGVNIVSVGTNDTSFACGKDLLKVPVLLNAKKMFFMHNHPSGNIHPSLQDKDTSKRLKDICDKLGIALEDSFIIGRNIAGIPVIYSIFDEKFFTKQKNTKKLESLHDKLKRPKLKVCIVEKNNNKDKERFKEEKTMENKKTNKVYINLHKTYCRERINEDGEITNMVFLPKGVIVDDKDLTNAIFNPKMMYECKFNKNLMTLQYQKDLLKENSITVRIKNDEGKYDSVKVDIDKLKEAVDIANHKYMQGKQIDNEQDAFARAYEETSQVQKTDKIDKEIKIEFRKDENSMKF